MGKGAMKTKPTVKEAIKAIMEHCGGHSSCSKCEFHDDSLSGSVCFFVNTRDNPLSWKLPSPIRCSKCGHILEEK